MNKFIFDLGINTMKRKKAENELAIVVKEILNKLQKRKKLKERLS